jgi:hypothetical protein
MRNHTTPKLYELVSQQGKNPAVTPGTTPQSVQFLLNNMPTQKEGKFWYYVTALCFKLVVTVNQPASGGTAITADKLWKIVQSVQVQCPLLGQLYTHQNTRGSVLGNIMQYMGFGFNRTPVANLIPAADGNTTVTLYYRMPFAYEFLCKPHETSPWAGFLEGGTVEIKVDANNVLGGDSTGAVIQTPCNLRCWVEVIPSPEACIHTPAQFREHQTPGNSTRQVIQDMGSPDGLQGIDMSKGVGLASLMYLMNPTGLGLAGSTTADNIISYDIPWRDQDRVDIPDGPFMAEIASMGNNRLAPSDTAAAVFGNGGQGGFPYAFAGDPQGNLNDASAMFFPLVMPGRDTETSKLQTVAGPKESNYTYGDAGIPSGINRFVGLYFPCWDEQFLRGLAARIAPQLAGDIVAKTLNKQSGGVYGVGKLAYVRAKVK